MGRRVVGSLQNKVREARLSKGLSQQQLAEGAGITRQAVNAIESGRYIPNTSVAIRLAQALSSRVEEIFLLPELVAECAVEFVGGVAVEAERVVVARVRDRLIAHPIAGPRVFLDGFTSADGLSTEEATRVQLLIPPELVERTALLVGCDPSLGILANYVARRTRDARLVWLQTSSQAALDAVAAGEVHIAGSHLLDRASGDYNLAQAQQALARSGGLVITYANWEQGFIVPPGNPKGLRVVADLTRPDVQFVNREVGSGSRALIDELLARASIPPSALSGYERVVTTHLAAARAVASGAADVGIGLRAVAHACDLEFVPLAEVRFDLVILRDQLEHPAVAALLEILQSRALRAELAALPGYSVSRMGATLLDLPAAA